MTASCRCIQRIFAIGSAAVLLICGFYPVRAKPQAQDAREVHDLSGLERKQVTQEAVEQHLKQARAAFGKSRAMLTDARVPFDPDELLDLNWRAKLAPAFASMPELQTDLGHIRRDWRPVRGAHACSSRENARRWGHRDFGQAPRL